jgi:hypothetical protein
VYKEGTVMVEEDEDVAAKVPHAEVLGEPVDIPVG